MPVTEVCVRTYLSFFDELTDELTSKRRPEYKHQIATFWIDDKLVMNIIIMFVKCYLSESDDSYCSKYLLRNNKYSKVINMLPNPASLKSFLFFLVCLWGGLRGQTVIYRFYTLRTWIGEITAVTLML